MRHGKAEDPSARTGYADHPRRLTSEGIENIHAMIPALRHLEWIPDRIVSSPYPRAAETAQLIHQELKVEGSLEYLDSLGSDRSIIPFYEDHLAPLIDKGGAFMVVGHEPCLSQLASLLICGRADAGIQLKKASILQVSCFMTGNICRGFLKSHWTSKQLRAFQV